MTDHPDLDLAGYVPETTCMAKGCNAPATRDVAVQRGHDVSYGMRLCDEHVDREEGTTLVLGE